MKAVCFFITSVFFAWLAHYAAVLPHEYAHSVTAWILGLKQHPFNIYFGKPTLNNLLLLHNIDENNNYFLFYLLGQKHWLSIISFAGPGLANGGMYIISYYLLSKENTLRKRPILYHFMFWVNVMSLGNLYDYVPIRTFITHGDVGHFIFALNGISPWWIMITFGYLIVFSFYLFYTKTLLSAYNVIAVDSKLEQSFLMIISTMLLFTFFGGVKSSMHEVLPSFMNQLSYYIAPIILLINWPSRNWIVSHLDFQENSFKEVTLKTEPA